MEKLTRKDLISLEKYAEIRPEFRRKLMAHKRNRIVHIGPNISLHFEDRLTMMYQIQEMLRAERIFEPDEIQQELDTYNPLIPDGSNWKGTLMIEYADVEERKRQLAKLIGIERKVWVQVDGLARVYPVTNEDLQRETSEKTSSVHFLRFELSADMVSALKRGAEIKTGVEHEHYTHVVDKLSDPTRESLLQDLN
jgi:hypothetical protein